MAEWSIAAVLKTVELRGSGGSNPSLSAEKNLQGIKYQPCRFFYAKKCTRKILRPACVATMSLLTFPQYILFTLLVTTKPHEIFFQTLIHFLV